MMISLKFNCTTIESRDGSLQSRPSLGRAGNFAQSGVYLGRVIRAYLVTCGNVRIRCRHHRIILFRSMDDGGESRKSLKGKT